MNAKKSIEIKMKIIETPKEENRAIFKSGNSSNDFIFIVGKGDTNYICGKCGNVLCKSVFKNQIENIVFVCPKCNSYNEILRK